VSESDRRKRSGKRLPSWLLGVLIALVAACVLAAAAAAALGVSITAPARLVTHFPARTLAQEADTMADCVECHEADKFHDCQTCHDDHGSAELANLPFNNLLLLVGDVPEPGYIAVNDILPYRDQPNTHIGLLDFLAERQVTDFESVTLTSRDGGFVTLTPSNLTSEALLMPHVDGVRFAAENLHVSTWLKGIWRFVVVGVEKPLTIDGWTTSMGRLYLGPTRSLTIEQTDVMFKSETDGQIRKGKTASRIEGTPVDALVTSPDFEMLRVRDATGQEHTLTAEEAKGALLTQLRGRPEVVLVLPGRSRAQWVTGVVEIASEE